MQYREHTNPTEIHCHKCGDDITLKGQNVVDSIILCDECFEGDDEYTNDDDDL